MSTESEVFEQRVGTHLFRFEPPDVVVARFVGDVSEEDILTLGRVYQQPQGKLYGIMATGQLGSINSDAKKAIRGLRVADGVAVVGATRQMQLVISILNKVLMIAHLGKNAPITFVQSEDEARLWVDHLRVAASKK